MGPEVGGDPRRRPGHEHHRRTVHGTGAQVAVVIALRSYNYALHPTAQQVVDQARFPLGVAAGVDEHYGQAVLLDGLADTQGQLRVEGVGQVADNQADGSRPPPDTEVAGRVVPDVTKFAQGRPHPLLGVVGYARVVVQGPGHGHGADAGQRGDIAHGGYRPPRPNWRGCHCARRVGTALNCVVGVGRAMPERPPA